MRMSCNGCRILRKGCSENCSIRPCLEWIKSPEAQANATVFLAKFYGRAGLLKLINAGPEHLRPAIFRSLLYEACGRVENPIYGSAGLLCSGNWQLCNASVEAVLSGSPISHVSSDSAVGSISPPLKACDIRHVARHEDSAASSSGLHKVKGRSRFKRAGVKPKLKSGSDVDGSASHQAKQQSGGTNTAEADTESVETVEATLVKRGEQADGSDVELELTLGLDPIARPQKAGSSKGDESMNQRSDSATSFELGPDCHA